MNKSILITGATGFVGRHVLEAMTDDDGNWEATALVRDPAVWDSYSWTDHIVDTKVVKGGLDDAIRCQRDGAFDGVDTIFHLAGVVEHSRSNPAPMYSTNVDGTLAMVQVAAATDSRLVVMSTSGTVACFEHDGVAGDEQAPFCDDVVADWPYYTSKIEMERRARQMADELGVELVFIRPPMLFGPRDHRYRSTGILLKFLRGKIPAMPNGRADFTDVRDVAGALLRVAELKEPRGIYHLPGTAISVDELFQMGSQVSGVERPRTDISSGLLWGLCKVNDRLQRVWPDIPTPNTPDPVYVEMASHYWNCTSLWAQSELGFEPRPPHQTLADTLQWLSSNAP